MQAIVAIAKALSDTNRVKILGLLLREHELCVCEICDTLSLSQPLVSRHLRQMREAGLIGAEQDGKWIIYSPLSESSHLLGCCLDEIRKLAVQLPALIVCKRNSVLTA